MIVALLVVLIFAVLFPGVLRALSALIVLVTLWQLWFGEPDTTTVRNPTTAAQEWGAKPSTPARKVY